MDDKRMSRGGYRLLFLILVILGLWIIAWGRGVTARFTVESIRSLLAGKGLWGIVAFTALFSVGQLVRVPGTVFVATAVAIYGRNSGMFIGLVGALASVTVSFAVIRTLAGKALADVQRPAIRRLVSNIENRPVMTVALLRLIFQTAPPLNYALPMTAIRWQDHLAGSMLGLPVPITVMALFFDWLLHRAA